jgi:hypothetical protein
VKSEVKGGSIHVGFMEMGFNAAYTLSISDKVNNYVALGRTKRNDP